MADKKEYVYDIEEYSQDTRCYQITSNVKLTYDEINNIYTESNEEKDKVETNLSRLIDWSNERFSNDEIDNKIKVIGIYTGTEYGDDCQTDITGDFEEE